MSSVQPLIALQIGLKRPGRPHNLKHVVKKCRWEVYYLHTGQLKLQNITELAVCLVYQWQPSNLPSLLTSKAQHYKSNNK